MTPTPDSLRAAADSNQTDSYGRWQMHAHADQWEAERKDNAALRERLETAETLPDLVPTNWLDPLLSGPEKVVVVSAETEIKALLLAVKARLVAALASQEVKP